MDTLKNSTLKRKLLQSENYSKRNNLKFFGIPESKPESTNNLLYKLATVLQDMDLNLSNLT
jgi:hypothetical protein